MASDYRLKMAARIVGKSPQAAIDHDDGFRTFCTSAILGFYGIEKKQFKFCQTVTDMIKIFNRDGWRMRPTKAANGKAVKNLNKFVRPGFYLISVKSHVILGFVSEKKELSFPVGMDREEYPNSRIISLYRIERNRLGK